MPCGNAFIVGAFTTINPSDLKKIARAANKTLAEIVQELEQDKAAQEIAEQNAKLAELGLKRFL